MAKKNDTTATASAPTSTAEPFKVNPEIAKFLPEGFNLDDFESVGGLRPLLAPDVNEGITVAAKIIAHVPMPKRKDGSTWSAFLVFLLSPARAKVGNDVIEIEAGQEAMIPANGNLLNNAALLNAAADAKQVHVGLFTCKGQRDIGKPSEMWDYDVKLNKKMALPRDGSYALYNKPAVAQLQPAYNGDVIGANGQPAKSLIGASASA